MKCMAPADAYRAISRELLVRYLDGCAPPLLHAARRLTYGEYDGAAGGEPSAVAALGVFAEFPELLAKRALHVVLAGADEAGQQAVGAARDSLGLACELHLRDGALLPALRGTGSMGTPVLAFVETDGDLGEVADLLAALAGNPGSDVLAIAATGDPAAAKAAGFAFSVAVELIAGTQPPRLLVFASNAGRHLDAVKDALWAADEYAGVRYREPTDPEHTALDISLNPGLGPLRRVLLAQLAGGPLSLAGLRGHTREQTIYRAVDAPRAVQALLHAGQARREPEHGRLGADTMIFATGSHS
jgi:hypothetical protein